MDKERYKAYKKVRKDWGVIDPRTKVKPNDKKYNRKKIKDADRKGKQ